MVVDHILGARRVDGWGVHRVEATVLELPVRAVADRGDLQRSAHPDRGADQEALGLGLANAVGGLVAEVDAAAEGAVLATKHLVGEDDGILAGLAGHVVACHRTKALLCSIQSAAAAAAAAYAARCDDAGTGRDADCAGWWSTAANEDGRWAVPQAVRTEGHAAEGSTVHEVRGQERVGKGLRVRV